MPILIAILAALSAAAFWYYRMRTIGTMAGDIVDPIQRARGAYRRNRVRPQADTSPYAAVKDPATAATTMLLALAALHDHPRPEDEAFIREQVATILPPETLAETFALAQRLGAHAADPNEVSLRFSKLWQNALTPEERLAFYRMAGRVIDFTAPAGGPTELQRQSLTRLKDRLGLFRV